MNQPVLSLNYISIATCNFEEMLTFYTEELHLDALSFENDLVYLGNKKDQAILFMLVEEEELEQPIVNEERALNHISFSVPTEEQFLSLYETLKNHGYECSDFHAYCAGRCFITNDPDGNQIEICLPFEIEYHRIHLEHIHLRVPHLKQTLSFYHDCLHLTVEEEDNAYLVYGVGCQPLIALEKESHPEYRENRIDFIALEVPSMKAVDDLYENLQERGWNCYYNRGKRIVQFLDDNGISYWIQTKELEE